MNENDKSFEPLLQSEFEINWVVPDELKGCFVSKNKEDLQGLNNRILCDKIQKDIENTLSVEINDTYCSEEGAVLKMMQKWYDLMNDPERNRIYGLIEIEEDDDPCQITYRLKKNVSEMTSEEKMDVREFVEIVFGATDEQLSKIGL